MPGDYVILLHGIFRTDRHMRRLANHLAKEGFDVINLRYPSTRHALEILTEQIWKEIERRTPEPKPRHFVGYSMGALLVRAILHRYRSQRLGRVVLLAPPNQGSEVADALKSWRLYRWLYGPAGQQLITDQRAISHLFGPVDYELGILAGDRAIDPIGARIIGGANDGKVAVERTRLEGMKEHRVVHASHTFFPGCREVLARTARFLRTGSFD